MTFNQAQELFRQTPTNKGAGEYLKRASGYWDDDMIGDDTYLNAVHEITYWLLYGRQISE